MAASLMPMPKQAFYGLVNGVMSPIVGGKVYTYAAGTLTPKDTYTTAAGDVANPNPVVLDARGEASVWLGSGAYDIALKGADDALIWTQENVSAPDWFLQAGTGAAPRTAQAKMRDIVSVADFGATGDGTTSDQTAVAAAVARCYSTGDWLYWPKGTYLTTATIPNFHDINHFGPGVVKRSADLFYITPGDSQTNTVYVATTGDDNSDGLSSGQPRATVQGILNILDAPYMPRMLSTGNFKIKFAAGTWTDGGSFTGHLPAKNWVYVEGEVSAGVPTTIIDGTTSSKTAGLYFDGGPSLLYVKNIASKNFRANSVASGFVFANKGVAQLFTENLHTTNNLWAGINCDSIGQWNAKGGIHDANTNYNLRARGGIAISIGRSDQRMTLRNNVTAMQLRDCCSGHFDYVDITNDPTTPTGTGFWVTNTSRVTFNEVAFTNCNLGIKAENNATFSYAASVTFTGVNTLYQTANNGSKDEDSADGAVGTGLAYDKFLNRHTVNSGSWGGSMGSATAHAFCTDKTTNADIAFLVPNATNARLVFGSVASSAYMRIDANIPNDRWDMLINSAVAFRATPTEINSGADNEASIGSGAARWSVVYAATGTINTSDAREKQQIRELSDAEHAVAVRLKSLLRAFKFNDAVQNKGDAARIHFGVIAQDVKAAFEAEGLVAEDYAILCYDEWPEQPEERDAEGNLTQKYRPAGNRYGVRYEELLAFIVSAI